MKKINLNTNKEICGGLDCADASAAFIGVWAASWIFPPLGFAATLAAAGASMVCVAEVGGRALR